MVVVGSKGALNRSSYLVNVFSRCNIREDCLTKRYSRRSGWERRCSSGRLTRWRGITRGRSRISSTGSRKSGERIWNSNWDFEIRFSLGTRISSKVPSFESRNAFILNAVYKNRDYNCTTQRAAKADLQKRSCQLSRVAHTKLRLFRNGYAPPRVTSRFPELGAGNGDTRKPFDQLADHYGHMRYWRKR